MALMSKDEQEVRNYAEKRASNADGSENCVVVYSIEQVDGVYYVADSVDPGSEVIPDNATFITSYGICSYVHFDNDDDTTPNVMVLCPE